MAASLDTIPLELRHEIYSYLLIDENTAIPANEDPEKADWFKPQTATSLFCVNRQIHDENTQYFYRENLFVGIVWTWHGDHLPFRNGSFVIDRSPPEKPWDDSVLLPKFLLHMEIDLGTRAGRLHTYPFVVSLGQLRTVVKLLDHVWCTASFPHHGLQQQIHVDLRTSTPHFKDNIRARTLGMEALRQLRDMDDVKYSDALYLYGDFARAEDDAIKSQVSRKISINDRISDVTHFATLGKRFQAKGAKLKALSAFKTCQKLAWTALRAEAGNLGNAQKTVWDLYLSSLLNTSQAYSSMLRFHGAAAVAMEALQAWSSQPRMTR